MDTGQLLPENYDAYLACGSQGWSPATARGGAKGTNNRFFFKYPASKKTQINEFKTNEIKSPL